jgi:hypothetical protein
MVSKFELSKTVIEITRRGLKQSTKYDILPMTNQPLTKEMEQKLNTVPLLALSIQQAEQESE